MSNQIGLRELTLTNILNAALALRLRLKSLFALVSTSSTQYHTIATNVKPCIEFEAARLDGAKDIPGRAAINKPFINGLKFSCLMRDNRPQRRFNDARSSGRFNKREAVFNKHGRRDERRAGDRPRLEMFDVVCARCGKDTQVPFKPTSSKPVYCRECFTRDGDSPRRDSPRRESQNTGEESDQLSQINRKLDKIMRALKIE
jgi:CxxC-x17-CxxC domain-containing protein